MRLRRGVRSAAGSAWRDALPHARPVRMRWVIHLRLWGDDETADRPRGIDKKNARPASAGRACMFDGKERSGTTWKACGRRASGKRASPVVQGDGGHNVPGSCHKGTADGAPTESLMGRIG